METINYYKDLPYYYKDLLISKMRYYIQPYINTTYSISKITDNVYISDLPTACNKEKLKEDGITHILSTIFGLDPFYPDDFEYKVLPLRDIESEEIEKYIEEGIQFIEDAINNGGKVLVHCSYGISRSASMVIAYLLKTGMRYNDAFDYVKSKREIIQPNKGFKKKLLVYGLEVNKDN